MRKELLSEEITSLVKNKKGYRYEALYGEGYTDVNAVCVHETFELENDDIPETILRLYKNYLTNNEIELLNTIHLGHEIDDSKVEEFGRLCEELVERVTGEKNLKCKWLCADKDDVMEYIIDFMEEYVDGFNESEIDEYDIGNKYCILSDIGSEGALIAFKF